MQARGLSTKKTATVAALFLLILILFSSLSVSAEAPDPPLISGGKAAVLYDKTHQKYLVEENGADMLNTSTSAKIMMGLLACEMLGERLEDRVTVTEAMLSEASGYSMKLKLGEQITVKDLLYGAICGSYNDAAYVLAHVAAGDSQKFVTAMNARAAELGAKATTYTNPLGYPDSAGMITTAYDTLKIALAASENALYMEICSALKHSVPETNKSDERQFYNRNHLVSSAANAAYYNASCKGMNAGFSGELGGWSIVTLVHDDGAEYVCVLLGGTESEDGNEIYAYDSVNTLVNWACKTYNNYTVFPAGAQLGTTEIALTGLSEGDAPYIIENDLTVYVPTVGSSDISYSIDLEKDLRAPLEAGTEIGRVTVTANGEKVGEGRLLLKESYEVNTVMLVIDTLGSYTKSRAFIATLICFAILLSGYLLSRKWLRYSPRDKYRRY